MQSFLSHINWFKEQEWLVWLVEVIDLDCMAVYTPNLDEHRVLVFFAVQYISNILTLALHQASRAGLL